MAETRGLGEFVVSPTDTESAESAEVGPRQVLGADEARTWAHVYLNSGWAVTAGPGLNESGVCSCHLGTACRTPGKHAHPGWGEGRSSRSKKGKSAGRKTMSHESVESYWANTNALWTAKPVDQVFVVPYLSKLVVADVDNMDKWLQLSEERDIPETLWQRSGSGRGGHFLFWYDWGMDEGRELPRIRGKIPGGAGEIKWRGIIAVAPSVHASGGRYEWANWGTPIAHAPEWLIERNTSGNFAGLLSSSEDFPASYAAAAGNIYLQGMFREDMGSLKNLGRVSTGRPVALFPAVLRMSQWIDAGWISEDEVVATVMGACDENGMFTDYGEDELMRQINNALDAGRSGNTV